MTPIEVMAKAYDEAEDFGTRVNKGRNDGLYYEVFRHETPGVVSPVVVSAYSRLEEAEEKRQNLSSEYALRAALLALAEGEIPDRAALIGLVASQTIQVDTIRAIFRAMLQEIARE